MADTPETKLKKEIKKYFKTIKGRGFFIKMFGSDITGAGYPDFIGIYRGYFVGIELKRKDGKGNASLLQEYYVRRINQLGGYGVVVKSLEEVKDLIKQIDKNLDLYNLRKGV